MSSAPARMAPWIVAGGALVFTGQHFLASGPFRDQLIAMSGGSEDGFRKRYSLVAMTTVGTAAFALRRLHRGSWQSARVAHGLWNTQSSTLKAARLFTVGCGVAFLSQLRDMAPSGLAAQDGSAAALVKDAPHGVLRITRSPMMTGTGLLAVGNMLTTPTIPGLLFWACMAATAWGGMVAQDGRLTRNGVLKPEFLAATSLMPFAAVVDGRQTLEIAEVDWFQLALSFGVFGLLQRGAGMARSARALPSSRAPAPRPPGSPVA